MLQQGPATPGQHRGAFAQHASRDPGSSSVHMYCAMGARSRRAGAAEASTSQHVRSARPGWCARGARPVHKFVHAFLRLGRERGRHLRGSRAQAGRQNEHRILAHTAREGRWDTYRCARPRKVCWGASSLTPLHAGHVDSCVKKFKVDFFFPTAAAAGVERECPAGAAVEPHAGAAVEPHAALCVCGIYALRGGCPQGGARGCSGRPARALVRGWMRRARPARRMLTKFRTRARTHAGTASTALWHFRASRARYVCACACVSACASQCGAARLRAAQAPP